MSPVYRRLLRNFAIEMVVYTVFLVIYFILVLRLLGQPLYALSQLNPTTYAGAALLLIVMQAVVLEAITSWLIERLGLERLE